MKRPCQRRRTLLPLVLALPVACSEVAVTAVDVARVDIEPATPSVIAGQSITLRATLRDARGNPLSGREVEWFSTDPSVATVDGNGVVTGMAVGSALVRASAGGREGEVSVTVQPKPVAAVVVSPATVQLVVDETRSLAAQPRAEDGEVLPDRAVAWQSENGAIATVDAAGVVRALAPGATRILAVAEGVSGAASISVAPKPVASVQVTPASVSVLQGDTVRLSAVLRSKEGTPLTGRTITWRSEDVAIARVDAAGLVTAIGAGSVRVIATAEGVEGAADVQVTVRPVAAVSVSPPSATLDVGATLQFHATVTAADGTALPERPVIWATDAPGVASIDRTGRLTAVSVGTATVRATAEGVTGTATVTVQTPSPVPVATVVVQPATLDLKPGDTGTLTAETRASDGTVLTGRTVSWTTSNAAVATVDGTGKVMAVADGTATITATSEGKSGSAAVTVKSTTQPVANVTVSPASVTLVTGGVQQFTATLKASDGTTLTGRTVVWKSSDAAVLSIDAQGKATALKKGSVTVTATSEGVSGTAAVTVNDPPPPPPAATVIVTPALTLARRGTDVQLTAEVRAADGTLLNKKVMWKSSDNRTADVDKNGLVKTKRTGTVTITATVDGKSGSAVIVILP